VPFGLFILAVLTLLDWLILIEPLTRLPGMHLAEMYLVALAATHLCCLPELVQDGLLLSVCQGVGLRLPLHLCALALHHLPHLHQLSLDPGQVVLAVMGVVHPAVVLAFMVHRVFAVALG